MRSSIIPSDITARAMNSFVNELIDDYLKPINQSLGNNWLHRNFPQSAEDVSASVNPSQSWYRFRMRDAYELAKSGKKTVPKAKEFVGLFEAIMAVFGGTPKILEGRDKQLEFDQKKFADMQWGAAFETVLVRTRRESVREESS